MGEVVIRAEHLSKRYSIGQRERYYTLRDTIAYALKTPFRFFKDPNGNDQSAAPSHIWSLKDISFEVNHGETVGIIGRNGAGKSTLLKILSRITEPTEGCAEIHGRVGSLLEVGTGFHPELTGRENIYLNGAILGMRKAEIGRKFDEIVAFAEVEKFLDTPVKHYSSGMHVRLAFAVAAHLEPEILLVDEVLAVGDAAFQRKCIGKMGDVAEQGRTVLFVSHNMAAILNLCERAVLLENGRIACFDSADKAVNSYLSRKKSDSNNAWDQSSHRDGSGLLRFKAVEILNGEGRNSLYPSKPVLIKMRFETKRRLQSSNVNIGLGVNTIYGERVVTLFTKFDKDYQEKVFAFEDETAVICKLNKLPLRPGLYYVTLYVDCNGDLADRVKDAIEIQIQEEDFFGTGVVPSTSQGVYMLEQEWRKAD